MRMAPSPSKRGPLRLRDGGARPAGRMLSTRRPLTDMSPLVTRKLPTNRKRGCWVRCLCVCVEMCVCVCVC